ncbi:MAG: potassium/proton antiporter [Acutalibacteraceae bacterium]|nr:potassium/proton antiporter [Acutalibacteraceae bacterium]
MEIYILVAATVILICLLLSKVSSKLGVPTLLVFIFLGMLFGSDGIFKIQFDNYEFAEQICSLSLIFIMFYGGFGTNWKSAKKVAVKSILLSTVGVVLTAVITGAFCHFVLGFEILESMLIGAVISSTDAASVFSILRSKRLNLKYNTASLLEVESGSNDPCSYMLTALILTFMSGDVSGGQIVYMIFAQIVYGVAIGVALAFLTSFILSKAKNSISGFESILVFSMALVSYALASLVGGNGYLSTYITGIILGNKDIKGKKSLVHFFDGITGLMQILIFFLLGLLAFPSQLPAIILPALAIALFLTFVARPISVFAILTPFKCPFKQQLLVSWSGLRGAASIVFAIMAVVSPAYIKYDVFHVVFFIVLFSISLQGTLIPFIAKKLDMIDNNSDVMKTFNDYTEEVPVQFLKLLIKEKHPWVNKKIKNIRLLPSLLIALIIRDDKQIVPKGDTVILQDDVIILSGPSLDKEFEGCLTEITIESDNEWLGMTLSEIKFGSDRLVILIKRSNRVIIPSGKTRIKENDVLIINQS